MEIENRMEIVSRFIITLVRLVTFFAFIFSFELPYSLNL